MLGMWLGLPRARALLVAWVRACIPISPRSISEHLYGDVGGD